MAADQSEMKFLGTLSSSYVTRVVLALKLKGIPSEYLEEDLSNMSELLLHYNPVHKKVPVLVHRGKPVAESLIILEYINDCWSSSPKLSPDDPHQRAGARFWANFYDLKVSQGCFRIGFDKGQRARESHRRVYETLGMFEAGIEKDFPEGFPFINGTTPWGFSTLWWEHGAAPTKLLWKQLQ